MLFASGMVLLLLLVLNLPSCYSDNGWTVHRSDSNNSGFVLGTGELQAFMESYRLYEERNVTCVPLSLDLDNDGYSELVYATGGGQLVVRRGVDGHLYDRLDLGGNISGSPIVFDHRTDGDVDLLVLVDTPTGTSIVQVSGTNLGTTELMAFPGNHSRGGGSIYDVDEDGNLEVVFATYEGFVFAVDAVDVSIDWVTLTGHAMAGRVAIFDRTEGPGIAVTSGLSYGPRGEMGCTTFYVLSGPSGDTEWTFEAFGTISTPPTVVREEPSVWIAFGTLVGNVYVLDVGAERAVLELERTEFDEPPYWKRVGPLGYPGADVNHLVLFGDRAIALLRISDHSLEWAEFHKYPVSMTDSLLCDIDGDGDIELVALNESVIDPHLSTLRFVDPLDGTVEIAMEGLPRNPFGLSISDLDDDGSLELLVCFDGTLIVMNEEPYIVVEDILPQNGSVFREGDPIEFKVLYTYRDPSRSPEFTWTSDRMGMIGGDAVFTIDELWVGHHVVTLEIDDSHGHSSTYTMELDVEEDDWSIDDLTPWLIPLTILVAVAGAAIVLLSKRRKG